VTAYGHYAIRGFEVHALDYLMKPVTPERLAQCIVRLEKMRPAKQRETLEGLQRDPDLGHRKIQRLMARSGAKLVVVNVDDVIAFESEDRLVFARTSQGRFVLGVTMKELEERLDAETFCRVHKQAIVRLSHAKEVHPMPGGQYLLKLADGTEVPIGRNYARNFRSRFL
jgi:DNA-binding LytR/AlgR family response regulator